MEMNHWLIGWLILHDYCLLLIFLFLVGAKVCCWFCGGGLQEGYGAAAKGNIHFHIQVICSMLVYISKVESLKAVLCIRVQWFSQLDGIHQQKDAK